jgi:glutamate formiminotransferase/formiminotetrahydrofolate cyclodeaminase
MVGSLTYGKRRFEAEDPVMRRILPPLHAAVRALVPLVDEDAAAYDAYAEALRLPQASAEEAAAREAALQEALRGAVEVPLRVMGLADRCWEAMLEMADHGNPASLTDLAVGAKALETGVWGAARNVTVNLAGVADEAFRREAAAEAERLADRAATQAAEVVARTGRR